MYDSATHRPAPAARALALLLCLVAVVAFRTVSAQPVVSAGDAVSRQDIQLLADYGILRGPVTTWPLAWGPVLEDLRRVDDPSSISPAAAAAHARLLARASWQTRTGELSLSAQASVAEEPRRIRGYENTPRASAEAGIGAAWTGNRVALSLQGQFADDSLDDDDIRFDGSMVGIAIGNWSLSANTLDRWWGPGWDGSLILSNNARPIPAVSLDRNFTDAFTSPWLRWIGPWDVNVLMGQLESERAVPDSLLFGIRFNFKPLPSLELGLSRTAQWCGDNRPCDAETFADLLLGRDNRGDDGLDSSSEPGNQMAGLDFRWSRILLDMPMALYGQFIGEDEAGGLPSRFIGLLGVEGSTRWRDDWSLRWFAEYAGTTCRFHESQERFNCAYNHGVYETGYRYRGRSMGHGADNDARLLSAGATWVNSAGSEWRLLLRAGELNRGPGADDSNTVTAVPERISSIDLTHRRLFRYGSIEVGAGYERQERAFDVRDKSLRFHLQWRSSY